MFFFKLLDIIFPHVCGFCGKPIKNTENTCTNCLSILKYYRIKVVQDKNHYFDRAISLFPYVGIIRRTILKFKFQNQKYLKYSFAHLMVSQIQKSHILFDVIIPVPISRKRYLERGFNQSKEIAKEMARMLIKPIETKTLVKKIDNQKQSTLPKSKRIDNVKGAYRIKSAKAISTKTVLLVDDIYTTGATVNECARVLKEHGASKVIVITIAYA